jgi:hypothetical protein
MRGAAMQFRSGWIAGLALFVTLLPASGQSQNLVPNGGFENGGADWNGGAVVAASPRSGQACLEVSDGSATASIVAYTRSLMPVSQGQPYLLTVWVRAATVGQRTLVTLEQYDTAGKWISGNNYDLVVTAGTDWREFHQLLRAFNPATAAVRLALRPVEWSEKGELTGTAWFDDASFEPTTDTVSRYGAWIVSDGPVRVWHSPSIQKVRRDAALPADAPHEDVVRIEAARGESEPAQLVLQPSAPDELTGAFVSDFENPQGNKIPSGALTIREVAFVGVTVPTDYSSLAGAVPDPLPLLQPPLALATGRQQPLWLTVKVPDDAQAGDYRASVRLKFLKGASVDVSLLLHVWDFGLPGERHFRTAYGISLDRIDEYHNLRSDPSLRREVFRLYEMDFADHRVSPLDVFGDDTIGVSFRNVNWPPDSVVPDPENPAGANRVLVVQDDRTDADVSVAGSASMAIVQGARYTLKWRARTDTRRNYLVALNQYNAAGAWISGHNIDNVRAGDGSWLQDSAEITPALITPQTATVRIFLYACPWTDAGELTGTTWFDDVSLTAAGSSTNLVADGDFQQPTDQIDVSVDFTRADSALSFALDSLGFESFRLPLPFFGWGDYMGGSHAGSMLGYSWDTPQYESIYRKILRSIDDHLDQRGWLERAYAYWEDEPHVSDFPLVAWGMDLLHRVDPRLTRLLTITSGFAQQLAGKVDIWVPILDSYDVSWSRERQALGESVWSYVCTGPKGPYPNDFIDHAGIEHRVRFWMDWQYGIQGDLYWDTTYWSNDEVFPPPARQDPWGDPMSYYRYQGVTGTWGNGDGRLLYPPRNWADGRTRIEGPTPSIRWELTRDGIEDFEYLWMLRDAVEHLEATGARPELAAAARALLSVPDPMVSSITDFSDNPGLLFAHRREVAETLERILPLVRTSLVVKLNKDGAAAGTTGGDSASPLAGYAAGKTDADSAPYGTAVFSFRQNGVVTSETAVPPSAPANSFLVFVNYGVHLPSIPGRPEGGTIDVDTGIAVANPGSTAANVTYTLRDATGSSVAQGHGLIAAGGHFARFVRQLSEVAPDFRFPGDFADVTRYGSLEISSDQPVSVVALRLALNQRGDALLTTVPVADLPGQPGTAPVYFPQFADGGGYTTVIVLLNTSGVPETGTLTLFDEHGAPLAVNQSGGTRDSVFRYAVPAGGVYVFQSDGFPQDVRVGWARLDPDPNTAAPVGAGIFSFDQGGIRTAETGIPGQTSTTHARIYVDQSGGHATGLALVNPAESGIKVRIRALRPDGSPPLETAETLVDLEGKGHASRFVAQFLAQLPAHFTGTLDVSSETPFAALTLRSLTNGRGDFLLNAMPVADLQQPAPKSMIFPQIVHGGGYSTEFILLGPGAPSTTILNFFGNDGAPLAVGK